MKNTERTVVETAADFKLEIVGVRLVKEAFVHSGHPFTDPYEAVAALGNILCEFDREVVCVINLHANLTPINVTFASVGALNEAMVHPRELLKCSILSNAASIMLVHSHPSGNLVPSKADIAVTDRMNSVCGLIGIPLIDHIIVGGANKKFFSFKERGMIDSPKMDFVTDYHCVRLASAKVADSGEAE